MSEPGDEFRTQNELDAQRYRRERDEARAVARDLVSGTLSLCCDSVPCEECANVFAKHPWLAKAGDGAA